MLWSINNKTFVWKSFTVTCREFFGDLKSELDISISQAQTNGDRYFSKEFLNWKKYNNFMGIFRNHPESSPISSIYKWTADSCSVKKVVGTPSTFLTTLLSSLEERVETMNQWLFFFDTKLHRTWSIDPNRGRRKCGFFKIS